MKGLALAKPMLTAMGHAEAQVLLLNTDFSVKELAARCGFADPNTFNRFIRRNMGMSPIAYRKSIKQKQNP